MWKDTQLGMMDNLHHHIRIPEVFGCKDKFAMLLSTTVRTGLQRVATGAYTYTQFMCGEIWAPLYVLSGCQQCCLTAALVSARLACTLT